MWTIRCSELPGKASGIYQVFPGDRIGETSAEPTVETMTEVEREGLIGILANETHALGESRDSLSAVGMLMASNTGGRRGP